MAEANRTTTERELYDKADLWGEHYWTEAGQERAEKTSALLPAAVGSVLDVGCGAGIVTRELARRSPRVVGLDFAFEPLLQVRGANIASVQGDSCALPFGDVSFDAVVSTEMVEHLDDATRVQALGEMARVAGEYILITVPYREVLEVGQIKCSECGRIFHIWHHTMSFDENVLSSLVPGFKAIKLQTIGAPTKRYPAWLFRALHRFGAYAGVDGYRPTCPGCGNTRNYVHRRPLVTYPLLGLRRVFPWRKRPRWIAALYQKM